MKILLIVGTRPNFIKVAPLYKALKAEKGIQVKLIHTGQHEGKMSDKFFSDLSLPKPDINVVSGIHGYDNPIKKGFKAGELFFKLKSLFKKEQPDWIVVFGDVYSTVAATVAAKLNSQRVAHVKAGLRSRDFSMPEEKNRLIVDRLADLLLAPSADAVENLNKEKVKGRVELVGNIMIDTLVAHHQLAKEKNSHKIHGLQGGNYIYLTLHRKGNVEIRETLAGILAAIEEMQRDAKVIWPIHPRTKQRIGDFGLEEMVSKMENLVMIEPVGYLDNICLITNSRLVLTDSGGIQEETSFLDIPCLTLRENTERPITVSHGTNKVVGIKKEGILAAFRELEKRPFKNTAIECWDGKTAERIVRLLK